MNTRIGVKSDCFIELTFLLIHSHSLANILDSLLAWLYSHSQGFNAPTRCVL